MVEIPLADKKNRIDKVLIYGNPGTGKTTSAWKYCKEHEYNPIVFDNNDTNYTPMPNIAIDFSKSHIYILKELTKWIPLIAKSEYDTIIIEDIGNLVDQLTPPEDKRNKFAAFKARADAVKKVVNCLNKSGCNLIFIGQSDMIIADRENKNDSENYSKPTVLINSMVNTAFYTYKPDENTFKWSCTKFRGKKGVLY